MGYIDINGVSYALPDGRPLLDDVAFRVGEGSITALIGANGAGKTTLLRIIRGDEAAHAGAVSIGGGLGVMDQFVGHGTAGQTVHDLLVSVAPPRVRATAVELEDAEAAIIERDDLDSQMRYAERARRVRRRRRLRARDAVGCLHRRRARHPVRARALPRSGDALGRRAEAARTRGAAARTRRGAAARRARQLPRRAGQALARGAPARDAEDGAARLARPRAARPRRRSHRDARGRRRRGDGVGARRRLRHVPPGTRRPDGAPRRAAPALGRAAREAQGPRRGDEGEGHGER